MERLASSLARRFIDATLEKWGTDEEEVYAVLQEVHKNGIAEEFEKEVEWRTNLNGKGVIDAVLRHEFSGASLFRAQDYLNYGFETYRASNFDYFLDGVTSTFDLSSTGSKIFAGALLIGGIALSILCPPVGAIVLGGFVVGTAGFGTVKTTYHGIEYLAADNEREEKEALQGLGSGVAITATAAPFVPKGISAIKNGISAIRAARASATTAAEVPTAAEAADVRLGKLGRGRKTQAVLADERNGELIRLKNEVEDAARIFLEKARGCYDEIVRRRMDPEIIEAREVWIESLRRFNLAKLRGMEASEAIGAESVGGNAGAGHFSVVTWVDSSTHRIVRIGNPQSVWPRNPEGTPWFIIPDGLVEMTLRVDAWTREIVNVFSIHTPNIELSFIRTTLEKALIGQRI